MDKILASGLIVLNTLLLLLPPALAQKTQSRDETPECTAALQAAKSRIEKGRKVKVAEISQIDVRQEEYTDYPKNRPFGYGFALSGASTESILKSTKFLTFVSADIIKNCRFVSRVDFGEYRTDSNVSFGLIRENTVQEFECIDPGSSTKITWGYVVCI